MHWRLLLLLSLSACSAAHGPDGDAAGSDAGIDTSAIDASVPSLECPVLAATLVGQPCDAEGAVCGDTCCSDAAGCSGGTWARLPLMECFVCSSYPCGDGSCRADQTCVARCGLAGGTLYACAPRQGACNDCSCLAITSNQRCETIDGHPHVSDVGPCI